MTADERRQTVARGVSRFASISATLGCIRERFESADGQLVDALALVEQFADFAAEELDKATLA